jgi:hypothetical protein
MQKESPELFKIDQHMELFGEMVTLAKCGATLLAHFQLPGGHRDGSGEIQRT